ncbi:MAG TPA: hypothetical protein VFH88_11630 [Candidatus Krumholzibacteria bacterium]|nr:hypothetical protein [Candidatus Krumholzibacteria bacterium]
MSDRKRIGRDPFDDKKGDRESETVSRLIRGRSPLAPDAREVQVAIKLTPANLKHLDALRDRLAARGREISRDELIRIAITLLSAEDVA